MRIGIDIDDTICSTSEIVHDRMEKYSEKYQLSPVMIMNEEEYKIAFFKEMIEDIYQNVEEKKDAAMVIRRLRNKGNEIYLITARSNYLTDNQNAEELTKNWLEKHHIEVDKIVMNAYGEAKAQACIDNKIDIMIDDDPNNFRTIMLHHIPCLLFDDEEQYDMKSNYVTSWIEVEQYLERNR